ncbi:hypothetical protein ACIKTA_11640, partial [Hansschlegelia beijingensis]
MSRSRPLWRLLALAGTVALVCAAAHPAWAQGRFRDVAGDAVSFAEQNMAASFDYAQKLLRA